MIATQICSCLMLIRSVRTILIANRINRTRKSVTSRVTGIIISFPIPHIKASLALASPSNSRTLAQALYGKSPPALPIGISFECYAFFETNLGPKSFCICSSCIRSNGIGVTSTFINTVLDATMTNVQYAIYNTRKILNILTIVRIFSQKSPRV